ncbi:LADA_0C05644g1_1 [Lachancea dasiensis]|uniref:LADA_0C05644g1_1 n=1 Tax=Lachancea dasiensis TaxID=1072105 RepID=A0A1G4IZM4_9SACH|nr:LADA_0C05644g1_1 [Lachancea dasiensis]
MCFVAFPFVFESCRGVTYVIRRRHEEKQYIFIIYQTLHVYDTYTSRRPATPLLFCSLLGFQADLEPFALAKVCALVLCNLYQKVKLTSAATYPMASTERFLGVEASLMVLIILEFGCFLVAANSKEGDRNRIIPPFYISREARIRFKRLLQSVSTLVVYMKVHPRKSPTSTISVDFA